MLSPLTSSSSTVLVIGITSKTRSPMEQRTFADAVLRPRLLSAAGVAKVAVFGGERDGLAHGTVLLQARVRAVTTVMG